MEQGQSPKAVATAFGLCVKTLQKWVARWRAEGEAGLRDRLSRPHRLRRSKLAAVVARVEDLRRRRWTGKAIAAELGISPATVSRILRRRGLSRLRDLAPAEPACRYQRERPDELIHIDIEKLGRFEAIRHRITGDRRQGRSRGAGWEFVMSASTTPRGSPSPGSCRTRRTICRSPSGAAFSLRRTRSIAAGRTQS